jgi:hypothetical protein
MARIFFVTLKYPNISMTEGNADPVSSFTFVTWLLIAKGIKGCEYEMETNRSKIERNSHATSHARPLQTRALKAYFRICSSCFWCASYLLDVGTISCPSCKTEIGESIPITLNENFSFDYSTERGVSLGFTRE